MVPTRLTVTEDTQQPIPNTAEAKAFFQSVNQIRASKNYLLDMRQRLVSLNLIDDVFMINEHCKIVYDRFFNNKDIVGISDFAKTEFIDNTLNYQLELSTLATLIETLRSTAELLIPDGFNHSIQPVTTIDATGLTNMLFAIDQVTAVME